MHQLKIRSYLENDLHITQKRGAEMCGLTPQAFGRIVNGQEPPYSKRGPRIADALGWQGDWRELFEPIEIEVV